MVTVSRAIKGVTINGDEFLLDENDNVKEFASKEAAIEYLKGHGYTDENIEELNFHEE